MTYGIDYFAFDSIGYWVRPFDYNQASAAATFEAEEFCSFKAYFVP